MCTKSDLKNDIYAKIKHKYKNCDVTKLAPSECSVRSAPLYYAVVHFSMASNFQVQLTTPPCQESLAFLLNGECLRTKKLEMERCYRDILGFYMFS